MVSEKTDKEKQGNLGTMSGDADCKSGDTIPPLSNSEIYSLVDDMMRNHFIGRRYFRSNI